MIIKIILTSHFNKTLEDLVKKRQLLQQDFDDLTRELATNPEMGDLIVGTGGLRKVRLKSASRGKSGGYRIGYYYFIKGNKIFLLSIYAKNVQENFTVQQKKELKKIIDEIKEQND